MSGRNDSNSVGDAHQWNHSLSGDYLWSNVNFGEAITDVMTPLTWSVVQFTLDEWVFLPGIPTVGTIGGRPYLNISVFATLFHAMGRSRQDLLNSMASTLNMHLPDRVSIPTIHVSRSTLWRGLFCALGVQLKQQRGIRRAPSYVASNPAWFKGIRTAIRSQTTPSGLCDLWQSELGPHLKAGAWCTLGSVTRSADYTLRLRRELAERVGPEDADILIANMSATDAPLESLGPLTGLDELARGEISTAAYLEAYGHRGPHEFELSVPRPAEDPTWLERQLEGNRRSPVDVQGMLATRRQSFSAAWKRLETRSSRAARRLRRRIAESARRARLRELVRSAYVRDRWAARLFAVRAGELTALGDQVFCLTLGELLGLLSGDGSVKQAIPSRIDAYQRYKTLPPYPPVIWGRFDPFAWAADPARPTDIFCPHLTDDGGPAGDVLVGSPGSAGVVEGTVRRMDHPEAAGSLLEGEILVAAQTDVAWTLLFPRAGAVVTDVGAPLSHAAIVARELGIPAVVGCSHATAVLKTGDWVRVDGGRGKVEILSRDAEREA